MNGSNELFHMVHLTPHIHLYLILIIFHHRTMEALQVLAIAPEPFLIFLS